MIPSYPDVVETSSNLAIIHIEPTKASIMILARSSREDMRDYISAQFRELLQYGWHEDSLQLVSMVVGIQTQTVKSLTS